MVFYCCCFVWRFDNGYGTSCESQQSLSILNQYLCYAVDDMIFLFPSFIFSSLELILINTFILFLSSAPTHLHSFCSIRTVFMELFFFSVVFLWYIRSGHWLLQWLRVFINSFSIVKLLYYQLYSEWIKSIHSFLLFQ